MVNKIEWFAAMFGIIGAFTVASNTAFSGWGYIPFLIGAMGYIFVAYTRRDIPLFLLNMVFACANMMGILRWLLLSN